MGSQREPERGGQEPRSTLNPRGVISFALILLMLAVACTGSPPEEKGVSFVYGVPAVPESLDSNAKGYEGDSSFYVGSEFMSTLVSIDPSGVSDGVGCQALPGYTDIKGEIAESWERLEGGSIIRFHLGDAVSPAGNEVTAEDVKWSMDRSLELSSITRYLSFDTAHYAKKDAWRVVDDKTIDLHLARPNNFDLMVLTWYEVRVLDSTEAKAHATAEDPWANDWLSRNSADYGPWQVVESDFVPGKQLTLRPNKNYASPRGNIDEFVILEVPESSTRLDLLSAGELDYATKLDFGDYAALSGRGGVRVDECLSANRDVLMLQIKDPKFADPRVRQAISLGIDRNALVQGPYRGFGQPAKTAIHQGYGISGLPSYLEYDPDEARRLLAEAGAENLSFQLTVGSSRPGPQSEASAVLIRDQLAQIGVRVEIRVIPGAAEYQEALFGGNFEAIMAGETPIYADPFYALSIQNPAASFQNSFGYDNPRYDELVDRGLAEQDEAARIALLTELAEVMAADPPTVYLVDRAEPMAWRSDISDWKFYTFYGIPNGFALVKS